MPGLMLVLASGAARAQETDSLVARVQQLVNAGNRPAARALADSALTVRTPGTTAYGEALYARAVATSDAGAAERDYLRVSVEYPFSARAEDAIFRVGQLRQARGDRAGARSQYERLAREYPTGPQTARASYWAGRLALDDGDLAAGCASLFTASERAAKDDVELRNQIEYLRNRCMQPVAPPPPAPDSARADATSAPPARDTAGVGPTREFSVQVAAFARKRDADALVTRLKARGFQVRSVGAKAPYRVRVGRYASREEAVAAQGRMKAARVSGIVVEAEAR
jgi:cell division septation protein DedD